MIVRRFVTVAERAIAATTSAALAFCVFYVVMAVVGPRFGLRLPDEDLLVSEAVVIIAFLPQLVLVVSDRQLSVDLFVSHLSGRSQVILSVFANLCGCLAYILLTFAGWMALDRALDFGSVSPGELGLLEWPARLVVVLGCLGGLLACLVRIARDLGAHGE